MKVDDDLARQVIKPRLRESHKGSYGRVLFSWWALPLWWCHHYGCHSLCQ